METIEKLNFLSLIDYKIFSFDVGTTKPDPRIFEKMLEVSGCEPNEVIMVGDNFDYDVEAARNVGMNAIHFRDWEQLKRDFKEFGIELE
jgi:putative hydrolase of the HAD superfamily